MINIAIIPAAGKGTRMLPSTRAHPKELIYFGEKPIIERAIDVLRESNIKKILIIAGHKKGALLDYLGDGSVFGVRTSYIHQEKPLGLGHAVFCAEQAIKDQNIHNFVVYLGDTIITPSTIIKNLIELHDDKNPLATILVEPTTEPERYGVVQFKELKTNDYGVAYGEITSLHEKPNTPELKKRYEINGRWYAIAGIYAFSQKIFEYIKQTPPGI